MLLYLLHQLISGPLIHDADSVMTWHFSPVSQQIPEIGDVGAVSIAQVKVVSQYFPHCSVPGQATDRHNFNNRLQTQL